jgi:hypothetical protein
MKPFTRCKNCVGNSQIDCDAIREEAEEEASRAAGLGEDLAGMERTDVIVSLVRALRFRAECQHPTEVLIEQIKQHLS